MSLRENLQSRYLRSNLLVVIITALLMPSLIFAQTKQSMEEKRKDANFHIANMTNLGIKALRELSKGEKNAVVCPLLLYNSLSLLLLGTEGQTAKEIEGVLGFEKKDLERWGKESKALLYSKEFEKSFLYKTEMSSPESVDVVHAYIDVASRYYKTTFNKIPDNIVGVDEQGRPLLYAEILLNSKFISTWQKPFNPEQTSDTYNFRLISGEFTRPKFMMQGGKFNYTEDSTIQAVEKRYVNRDISIIYILPKGSNTIENIIPLVSYEYLKAVIKELEILQGTIIIPRVKYERKESLNGIVQGWGIETVFKKKMADLSGMWPFPGYISNISLIESFEMNEEKTVAENEIKIEMVVTGSSPSKETNKNTFTFLADHPFFFIIYDKSNSLPLFIGVVYEP